MPTFWTLLKDSTIVQASITLLFALLLVYLVATARPIPGEIYGFFGTILGYWFGTKAQQSLNHTVRSLTTGKE